LLGVISEITSLATGTGTCTDGIKVQNVVVLVE
jgi:hypothetical protein